MSPLLHHKGRAPITDARIRHLARNGIDFAVLKRRLRVNSEWLRARVRTLDLAGKVNGC